MQEILDLLGLVEAAHQVLEWLCLGLHPLMEATEERPLCIMGRIMAVAVVDLPRLQVRMVRLRKDAVVVLLPQQAAATGLLVRPQRRHRQAQRIRAAAEVVVRILWVDIPARQVGRAS